MILLKCLLKISWETFPYSWLLQNPDWSHTGVIDHIQYTDYLKYDLCNCAIHIMVPSYHKYIIYNITLTYYCHSTHPFTMEERKVNIVQRHKQEPFIQDIPLSSHHIENTGNMYYN